MMLCVTCMHGPGAFNSAASDASFLAPVYDRSWQIVTYHDKAGVAGLRVFELAFETNGTAWFATSDGLHRYDGYHWTRFGTNDGLPSSFVRAVCVTRSGKLWVGSDTGAGVFDHLTGKYETLGSEKELKSPYIRHIVEDPDGTLWFCCDQWPDTTIGKGGLTRYAQGKWNSYDRTDGLPINYVLNYYRDKQGQQYVMTLSGWRQREGEKWGLPKHPGYEKVDRLLMMAEASDGTLFAQGEQQALIRSRDQWNNLDSDAVVIGTSRDGEVICLSRDATQARAWFGVWNGQRFAKASSPFSVIADGHLYQIRQAPDGTMWAVGSGLIVRWLYKSGQWNWYPELPRPQKLDALGRLWFYSGTNVVVRQAEEFRRVPVLKNVLAVEPAGTVWGQSSANGTLGHLHANNLDELHVASPELTHIKSMLVDAEQRLWAAGKVSDTDCGLAYWDSQRWIHITSPYFTNKTIQNLTADPRQGIWLALLSDIFLSYSLVHVTTNNVVQEEFRGQQPPLTYPNVAFGGGSFWLHGYSGLYHRPVDSGDLWNKVTTFPLTGVHQILEGKEDLLVVFNGGREGFSGCALYHEHKWLTAQGMYNRASISPDKTTYFLPAQGRICVRREHGTLNLENIPLPMNEYAMNVLPEATGHFWVSTPEGALHYQPDDNIPNTQIRCSLPEISEGFGLPVIFEALERFSPANPHWTFQFSWQVDGGAWSSFSARPSGLLQIPGLPPGKHRLQVRARDAHHNVDPTPAGLNFTVLPTPLQRQFWFMPVVTVIAGVIAILIWLGIARSREIAQRNVELQNEIVMRKRFETALEKARDELEQRVKERTAELSHANEALTLEIAERQQAEAAQRKLEEQLQQAQKLKAIGTLAGGIAHDFNNILAAIIPYTQFAMTEAAEKPQVVADLQQVLAAANRAKKLVLQILTFSRQQKQECSVITLPPIVEETLHFIRSVTPPSVVISSALPATLPPVYADATQIHQVLVNLCTNAFHAMRGKEGRLQIKLDAVAISEAQTRTNPDLNVGPYVRLSVQDNGCGMDEQVQQRVFEPFFTTKGPAEGTGLGLAVVHGIVKAHAGAITLKSSPGMGSCFEIYLPIHTGESPLESPPPEEPAPGKGQHILVVDDEAAISTVISRVLVKSGYQVTAHTSPAAALQEFAAAPKRFDLVFTDLSMPGLSGLDLATAIQAIRPGTPIILATGYGGDFAPETSAKTGIRKCLNKPLSPQAVLNAVKDELAGKPS